MGIKELQGLVNESIALRKPNLDKVAEYAERMKAGVVFPPVVIGVWPKTEKYGETGIIDGLHRMLAAVESKTELSSETKVFKTLSEALAYGYEANMRHGYPVSEGQRNKRIVLMRQLDPTMNIDKLAKVFGIGRSSIDRILKGEQGEGKSGPKGGATKSSAHQSKDPMKANALYKTIVKLNREFVRKRPAQIVELAGYLSPITEGHEEGEVDKERVAEVSALIEHLVACLKLLRD